MLVAGYLKIADALPRPMWKYPLSYVAFHTYAIEVLYHSYANCLTQYPLLPTCSGNFNKLWNNMQGLLENEYIGTSFAVGQIRAISGVQAVHASYNISSSASAKWWNLLALFLMAVGYRVLMFVLLQFQVRKNVLSCNLSWLKMNTTTSR